MGLSQLNRSLCLQDLHYWPTRELRFDPKIVDRSMFEDSRSRLWNHSVIVISNLGSIYLKHLIEHGIIDGVSFFYLYSFILNFFWTNLLSLQKNMSTIIIKHARPSLNYQDENALSNDRRSTDSRTKGNKSKSKRDASSPSCSKAILALVSFDVICRCMNQDEESSELQTRHVLLQSM